MSGRVSEIKRTRWVLFGLCIFEKQYLVDDELLKDFGAVLRSLRVK